MSTRAMVKIFRDDLTQTGIYIHWDGYIEYTGVILQAFYNTPEKVEKLIALGDLSSIDERTEPSGEHSYNKPEQGVCVAYHRDRGEEFTQTNCEQEYNYYYYEKTGVWYVDNYATGFSNVFNMEYDTRTTTPLIDEIMQRSLEHCGLWFPENPNRKFKDIDELKNTCLKRAMEARTNTSYI